VDVQIEDLIRAIGEGNVAITRHAEIERRADDLGYEEIYFSVVEGEIIEEYPQDKPYPSCLVYGDTFEGEPVHSVWTYNEANGAAVLITVYRPNPARWINFRERRPRGE
jgi:hypothetical protein